MTDKNQKPVCLITGGSSGIGLATGKRFAGQGWHVTVCGRQAKALADAKTEIEAAGADHEIQCLPLVIDLDSTRQAKKLAQLTLEHFGRVDVLVNNAAMAPLAPFEELTPEVFEATININIRSLFYLTQSIWAHMKQRERLNNLARGTIVNISSMAAVDPFPGFSLYGACKSWLDLMTLALAGEGKELDLRVCSIRPGAVETPLLRNLFPDFPADQCVSPERIADAVWSCVAQPDQFPSGEAFAVTQQS